MALVNKYCNPTGAGAHDGSTPADAWSFTEAIAGYAAGNVVNMLAGAGNSYDNTTNTRTLATAGTTTAPVWWRGYKTTIGDQDNNNLAVAGTDIPAITFTTGSLAITGAFQVFSNIDISGATLAASFRLFNCSANGVLIYRCRFRLLAGATANCTLIGGNAEVMGCYFSSAVAQPLVAMLATSFNTFMGNYFSGGSVGLSGTTGTGHTIMRNVFDAVGGDAIQLTTGCGAILGNSVYAPTGHGVTWSGTPSALCNVTNNHFENVNQASKAAINNGSGTPTSLIKAAGNSYFQCTANVAGQGDVPNVWDAGTLAGSGFVNAAGHDFTPSTLLKNLGFPGLYENISVFRGYLDLGAVQAQAVASGGRQPMYRIRGG